MTSLELSNFPNTSFALPKPNSLSDSSSSPPLSFSDFRFKTIGQEPQLLKRLTAPDPSHTYRSRSPTPAIATLRDLPGPLLSRPSLLQVLTQETSFQSDLDALNSPTTMATTSNVKSQTCGQAVSQPAQLNDMTNTRSHQSSKVNSGASSVVVEKASPSAASPMNIEPQTAGLNPRVNESTTSTAMPVPSGDTILIDIDQPRPIPEPSEPIPPVPPGGSGDMFMVSSQRQDIYSPSISQELSYPPVRPSPLPPLVERAPLVIQTKSTDSLSNDTSTHTTQPKIPPGLSPLLALQSRVNLALSQHSELLATLTPLAVFLTQSAASAHATSLVASASAQKAAATVQHAIAQVEFCRVQADTAKFEAEQAASRAQIAVNAAEAVRLKIETAGVTEKDIGEVIMEVKGVMEWAIEFARGWEEKRKEEAEAGRKAAEENARKLAEEEARKRVEEADLAEQKRKADEEARLRAEEQKRLIEEEKRKAAVEEERCQQEERERRRQEQIALDAEKWAREAAERKRRAETDLEKQRQEEARRQEYERRQAEVVAKRGRAINEKAAQIVAQRGKENAKEGQRPFESEAPGPSSSSPSIASQLMGDLPADCPQLVETWTGGKPVSGSAMLSSPGGDSRVRPVQTFQSLVSPLVPSRPPPVLPPTSAQVTSSSAGESKPFHNPFVPAVTEAGKRVATDTPLSSTTLASEKRQRQRQRQTGTTVGAISQIASSELAASTVSLSANNLKPDPADVNSPLAILSSDKKDRHVSAKSTKVSPAQQPLNVKLPQAPSVELSQGGPGERTVTVKAEPSPSPNLNTNRPLPPSLPRPSPEVLLGTPASAGIPMPRSNPTVTRNSNSTAVNDNRVDDQTLRDFPPVFASLPAQSQIPSTDGTRPPSPLAISPAGGPVSLAPPNSSISPPTGFASSDSRGRPGSYNPQPQRRRQPSGMDHYSPVRSTLRPLRDHFSPPRQLLLRRTNDYRRSSSPPLPPSNFILPRREYDHYSPTPEAPYLVGSQSPPNLLSNRKRRREEGTMDEGGPARRAMRNDRSPSPVSGSRDRSPPNRGFEMLPDRISWSPPRMPASMRIGDSGDFSIIYEPTPGEHNRRPASSRPPRENIRHQNYGNHDSYRKSGVQSPPLRDYNETIASASPALYFSQPRLTPSSSTSDRTPLLARMSDSTGPPIAPRAPANTGHTRRATERGAHQPRGQGRARGTTRVVPRGTLASRLSSSTTHPVALQDRLTD